MCTHDEACLMAAYSAILFLWSADETASQSAEFLLLCHFLFSSAPEKWREHFQDSLFSLRQPPSLPTLYYPTSFLGVPVNAPGAMDASQLRPQHCPASSTNKASFCRGKKSFPSPLSPLSPWERGSSVCIRHTGGMGNWGLR